MSTSSDVSRPLSLDQFRSLARQSRAHDAAVILARPRTGEWMPASSVQERLWLLEQLAPAHPAYHVFEAARLAGRLDVAALERSVRHLVARHEVLRTAVDSVDGRVMQRPLTASFEGVRLVALDAVSLARAGETVGRLARLERHRVFDLRGGRVLRACLVRLSAEDHILLLTMHHVAADLLSIRILIGELGACYEAFANRCSPELPPLGIQYADYAAWEQETLQSGRLDRLLHYWREMLAGAQPLELPCDYTRRSNAVSSGHTIDFAIDGEVHAKVKRLARAEGATPFMVYLAVFGAVLRSYASTDDVCVGVPVANRSHAGVQDLVGPLINTLVLRMDLSGNPSFTELLSRVRRASLGAFAHQDLPFETLAAHVRPDRDPGRNPFFNVLFQHQQSSTAAARLGSLHVTSLATQHGVAKFDLTLTVAEQESGVQAWLEYSTELFRDATVAGMRDAILRALKSAVDRPATPAGDLLLDRPRSEPLVDADAAMRCVHERFLEHAHTTPDAVAVVDGDAALTYGQLAREARRWARVLAAQGVTTETRVVLYCERGTPAIVGALAVILAGGAYVPVDPAAPRERLTYVLEDAHATILLGTRALIDAAGPVAATVIAIDEPAPEAPRVRLPAPSIASVAYVIYTSGSTGTPKGVEVDHGNVARLFDRTDAWYHFGVDDVWPLFHSMAFDVSVWEMWGALAHGGRLVAVPHWIARSPSDFSRLLREAQATALCQTPSAFRQISEHVLRERETLPSIRTVIFAGEALNVPSLDQWFRTFGDTHPVIVNMYGITETTVHSSYRVIRREDVRAARAGSPVGEPIPDLGLLLLDPALRAVPQGALGEIVVSGAGVARGYLNRPALTAERFIPDPAAVVAGARAYRSGDLARLAGDGEYEYIGRLDHQVKIRGFRVELGEIEAVVARHPAVRQSVVLSTRDGQGDVRLIAYVVPQPGQTIDPLSLRAHAAISLPDYMVPAGWVTLDRLPLTINGKLDRKALPAPGAALAARDGAYVAPSSLLEEMLCDIWKEVLGVARAGIDDDFFALGGHSLKAVQVLHRIKSTLHVDLPLRDFFNAPTVAATAAAIEAQIGEQALAADA